MSMTVNQLRDALADLTDLPGDALVILQKDAEGNGYSPLYSVDRAQYAPDSTWSGECWPTAEQIAADGGEDEWGCVPDDALQVILLGPVN